MIEIIAKNMLSEIQKHKRNKNQLLPYYIQKRLNKQVQSYYKQILDSYNILSHQENEAKLAKNLVKNFENM